MLPAPMKRFVSNYYLNFARKYPGLKFEFKFPQLT